MAEYLWLHCHLYCSDRSMTACYGTVRCVSNSSVSFAMRFYCPSTLCLWSTSLPPFTLPMFHSLPDTPLLSGKERVLDPTPLKDQFVCADSHSWRKEPWYFWEEKKELLILFYEIDRPKLIINIWTREFSAVKTNSKKVKSRYWGRSHVSPTCATWQKGSGWAPSHPHRSVLIRSLWAR